MRYQEKHGLATVLASRHGFDGDDRLRVWGRGFDFDALVSAVFDQLRAYFAGDRNASVHMLERMGDTGEFLRSADQRKLIVGRGAIQCSR